MYKSITLTILLLSLVLSGCVKLPETAPGNVEDEKIQIVLEHTATLAPVPSIQHPAESSTKSYSNLPNIIVSLDKHPVTDCTEINFKEGTVVPVRDVSPFLYLKQSNAQMPYEDLLRMLPEEIYNFSHCWLVYPTETEIVFLIFEPESGKRPSTEFLTWVADYGPSSLDGFFYSNVYVYSDKSLISSILLDLID